MKSPALIYNAEIRNNGTARRVQDAFVRMGYKESGMVRYNRPSYNEIDYSSHDFWLYIDDGRDDIPMERFPSPSACWLVDTHLGYETRLEWAKKFDHVFLCQLPDVAKMQYDGVENVHWLPLACSPNLDPSTPELAELPDEFSAPLGLQKVHDVVFVGHMNKGGEGEGFNNRMEYLDKVFREFKNSWFAYGVFFEQAALRYARGRVGFNISIRNDLNMRFFENLSYGTCLVSNTDVEGWQELGFVPGEDFIGYEGEECAVEQVRWALNNPMEREKIAKRGHNKVREFHTYADRIETMLAKVYLTEETKGVGYVEQSVE